MKNQLVRKQEFKYAIETQKVDNINANQVMEIATYLQKVSIEMAKIESVIDYFKDIRIQVIRAQLLFSLQFLSMKVSNSK